MSILDALPPSPPTTNHRRRVSPSILFRSVMSTPDDSPASFLPSSGTGTSTGTGTRKRVGFSPWPNVVNPSSSTPHPDNVILKTLPPSRDCQTNSRSILKPSVEPIAPTPNLSEPVAVHVASPETLESIARQLTNNNKESSLDAYQTLSQVIKVYDEIPEDVNTRNYLTSILKCIKRDLSIQVQIQSNPIDTNLTTQALKVSVILVWSEHLSPLLSDEFRTFIVDRSINAILEHTAPKVVIIHYMHLLAMQNFRSSMLSCNNRTVRLLEALADVTNHVQGKGAIAERLLIYHKLVEQSKPIMKSRVNLWIKEVLTGLASPVKEIRNKAMSVSTRVCAAFPSSSAVASAARDALASMVFDRTGAERTLNAVLTQRLEKMVAAKDEAVQVPQIWSLSMLLCNSSDARLDSWSLLRDWLRVLQRCFNCSDTSVKMQAFPAWNRFIYISRPHEADEMIVSMLAKPIVSQIERTSSNTTGKGLRPAAVSSYCMLLYYSFRPAASHKQYTRMWNEYIVKIFGSQFLSKSTANADLCSRVVLSLMWKEHSASRIWNENRAHENTLLEPEDLPTIDCKWIRAKTEAILQIFRLLFKYSVWGPSVRHSDQSYIAKAWRSFVRAIRESASKEIKPSVETKNAVSHIIQIMLEISATQNSLQDSEGRSQLICNIAVMELGDLCIIETLEGDAALRSPLILSELLRSIVAKTPVSQHDHAQVKVQSFTGALPQSLQRCFIMLDLSLQNAYGSHQKDLQHLQTVIDTASATLKLLPLNMIPSCLNCLQAGLVMVIEDKENLATEASKLITSLSSWTQLSEVIVEKIVNIPLSTYLSLDNLISATLLSRHTITKDSLLNSWAQICWEEADMPFGPKLFEAVALLEQRSEIDHFGAQSASDVNEYHTRRDVRINSDKQGRWGPDCHGLPTRSDESEEIADGAVRRIAATENVLGHGRHLRATQTKVKGPSHHVAPEKGHMPDDNSVNRNVETDSQIPDQQQLAKSKPDREQVVVFADVGSRIRHRSPHSSRAPSVNCEMARKVAAVDDLPSTPTINRQQDNIDDDELPSPTPKSRNKILQIIDIDIPSSPPSISGNRRVSVAGQDVLSSPPRTPNETEMDLLNLGDAKLVSEAVVSNEPEVIKVSDGERSTAIFKSSNDVTSSSKAPEMHAVIEQSSSRMSPKLGSVVHETNQGSMLDNFATASDCETALGATNDQYMVNDEVDELSASQLSQSLSWHIAEQINQPLVPVDHAPMVSKKRRKRGTTVNADRDEKKRRRRTNAEKDTTLSSKMPEDLSSSREKIDFRDDFVVTTPIPKTCGRQDIPVCDISNAASDVSTVALVESHPISSQGKTSRMALHVKAINSQTTRGSSDKTENGDELQSAATEILEESIYQTMLKNSTRQESPWPELNDVDYPQSRQELTVKGQLSNEAVSNATAQITNVMTALHTALADLKSMRMGQHAGIDLKAIDDLCFKIRYEAQEIGQTKERH